MGTNDKMRSDEFKKLIDDCPFGFAHRRVVRHRSSNDAECIEWLKRLFAYGTPAQPQPPSSPAERAASVLRECLDGHTVSPHDVCACGMDKALQILTASDD